MNRLVKNEFKKNFSIKNLILILFIIIIIVLIYKYTSDIESFINTLYYIPPFIGIIISFYSSSIVSKEYTSGTFKQYLTKPAKRWKIIISKIIYLIILTICYELLTIITYLIVVLLTNNLDKISYLSTAIMKFIKSAPPIYFIICFSTYLSTLFRSSKISLLLSTILLILSGTISELLFSINWTFIEYTFLPYMDLSIFLEPINIISINELFNINLSLSTGNIILLIYSLVFIISTLLIFEKQDMHN